MKMANNQCKECGCACSKCTVSDHDVHLHVEIENLKQRLVERDNHIVTMETNFLNEANKFPNGELVALREELVTWQDKYKRLYEAHRRVQRVNQGLEDKLLRLVDVSETDKSTLTKDVATLSHKLAEANYTIKKLTEDNERYKNDVSLAIQFLQCKPGNFVSQKFDSLPNEVQAKVSTYMANKRKPEEKKSPPEVKSIKVPIPTFPPTAMVYSIPKSPNANPNEDNDPECSSVDIVSAAIMAKVLEERERERSCVKHCDTCTCSKNLKIIHHNTHHTVSTQTGDSGNSLCLSCNSSLENRASIVKIVKNVDNLKNKSIPVYIHDYNDSSTNQNIAKVQPNNFLIDTKNNSDPPCRPLTNKVEPILAQCKKTNKLILLPQVVNTTGDIHTHDPKSEDLINLSSPILRNTTTSPSNSNEETAHCITTEKSNTLIQTKICYKGADETKKLEKGAKVFESSEIYKGGRYCSMRLQTGSKNILLDNTPNNLSPVLYTRTHERRSRRDSSSKITKPDSISSEESKTISSVSENTSNQRVAEWIQTNINHGNTSDYSESINSQKTDEKSEEKAEIDKEKYKEMEDNVKRFLFGEYNFLKTVEIGKHKYETPKEKQIEEK